jgi:hypothetical protein
VLKPRKTTSTLSAIPLQNRVTTFIQTPVIKCILVAEAFAVVYWLLALYIRTLNIIPVWYDQEHFFTVAARHMSNPYVLEYFSTPPWSTILLAPLSVIPLELAVLLQLGLEFALLTILIVRYGGGRRNVLIMLTSYLAFDTSLEVNIDWIPILGMLLPVQWSMPFILLKPQVGLGYYLGCQPRDVMRAMIPAAVVVALSFLFWGWWPAEVLRHMQRLTNWTFNMAPMVHISPVISLLIGGAIAYQAVRRRDITIGMIAWLFFIPYIPLYSFLIVFSLVTVRWPRVALLISVVMWIVYGGTILLAIILR